MKIQAVCQATISVSVPNVPAVLMEIFSLEKQQIIAIFVDLLIFCSAIKVEVKPAKLYYHYSLKEHINLINYNKSQIVLKYEIQRLHRYSLQSMMTKNDVTIIMQYYANSSLFYLHPNISHKYKSQNLHCDVLMTFSFPPLLLRSLGDIQIRLSLK